MIVEDSPVGLEAASASGGVAAIKGAAPEEFAADFPYIHELSDLSESVIESIMEGQRPNFVRAY